MSKKKNKIDHNKAGNNKDNRIHNDQTKEESPQTKPISKEVEAIKPKNETSAEMKAESGIEVKDETGSEVKDNTSTEVKDETSAEVKDKTNNEVKDIKGVEVTDGTSTEASDVNPTEVNSTNESTSTKTSASDTLQDQSTQAITNNKNKMFIYKTFRIIFSIGFVVFTLLFINEVWITPLRLDKTIENTKELYKKSEAVSKIVTPTAFPTGSVSVVPEKEKETTKSNQVIVIDTNKDEQGRLYKFRDLLNINPDVKGWITIPKTNIDYVVLQSNREDPEFYLTRDINKNYLKAGSLFLDYKSSVELPTKNITIHGHNMTSTDNMFHYLLNFKQLKYYQKRPVFTFDSIYEESKWKIFSIFITNGAESKKESFFNYTRANFTNSSDFLNFVYQLRIRSMYHMDTVDVNENDQLLTLSTCTYEVKNYRIVIVARKVREGEDTTVDVNSVTINKNPLNPPSYYYRKGGKAPKLADSFEEALANGAINWYKPVEDPTTSDSKDKSSDIKPDMKETDTSINDVKSDKTDSSDIKSVETDSSDTISSETDSSDTKKR